MTPSHFARRRIRSPPSARCFLMRIPRLLAALIAPLAVVLTACLPQSGAGLPPVGNSPVYNRAADPWGPDVSGWQHPAGAAINWAKVRAAGASFAFVKVSEGTGY